MIDLPEDVRNRLQTSLRIAKHCGNQIADIDVDDLSLILNGPPATQGRPLMGLLDGLGDSELENLRERLETNLDD
jgi:hypothetical protein